MAAALKAIRVPDVPNLLDNVVSPSVSVSVSTLPRGSEHLDSMSKLTEFLVIGHRGNGMNSAGPWAAFSSPIKENSIRSFNEASRSRVAYVEFDVQVTRDGHPVIFHDTFILSRDADSTIISEKRVTDLSLQEFRAFGPQSEENTPIGKELLRRIHDGTITEWVVEHDAPHCTLEEAFLEVVDRRLGFNIELKFDDDVAYEDRELEKALGAILTTVAEHAGSRPVMFSTFQPDAARLVRRLQSAHPVFFLTDGGTEIYSDARRNSLEEAVRLCAECGLQGVVSEVRAVLRNPWVLSRAREMGVGLLTYGEMNNVAEIVRMQHLMGIDGVIVDRVREIADAVSEFVGRPSPSGGDDEIRPMLFSQQENNISFLLKPMIGY